MVKENQISITEFELVFFPLIQRHSSYNMEHANVRYARRTPSHTLHEQKILWDVVVSLEKGSYTFILNIKSDCSWHKNHQREYFNSTSWLKFAHKSDLSDIRHTVLLHFHLFSWRLTAPNTSFLMLNCSISRYDIYAGHWLFIFKNFSVLQEQCKCPHVSHTP